MNRLAREENFEALSEENDIVRLSQRMFIVIVVLSKPVLSKAHREWWSSTTYKKLSGPIIAGVVPSSIFFCASLLVE